MGVGFFYSQRHACSKRKLGALQKPHLQWCVTPLYLEVLAVPRRFFFTLFSVPRGDSPLLPSFAASASEEDTCRMRVSAFSAAVRPICKRTHQGRKHLSRQKGVEQTLQTWRARHEHDAAGRKTHVTASHKTVSRKILHSF